MRTNCGRDGMWRAIAAATLLAAIPGTGIAQDDGEFGEMMLRTYEVGDLVVNVPDYAAGAGGKTSATAFAGRGGFGGGGGMSGGGYGAEMGGRGGGRGGDAVESSSGNQVTLGALQQVIVRTVMPSTWAVNGTGDGQIEQIGAALVVLNTRNVQSQIDGLLGQLRAGSANRRSVAIDARWLLLDSDDLDALVATSEDGARKLDREKLAAFTRRPTSLRGMTNCFSGQSVYLISGTVRNVVSSYIPVVGSLSTPEPEVALAAMLGGAPITFLADEGQMYGGRSVGYQPVIEKPNFGVLLQIRPTVMHNEGAAVVDLTSTITFPGLEASADASVREEGRPATPQVDRLAIDTQELATTLRVTLGEPTLVGGMSYIAPGMGGVRVGEGAGAADSAGGNEVPQLYLVLEIR